MKWLIIIPAAVLLAGLAGTYLLVYTLGRAIQKAEGRG